MCVGLEMRQYVFNYTGNDTGNDDDPHSPSIGFFFNYNIGVVATISYTTNKN